jgi:hypothetical protein
MYFDWAARRRHGGHRRWATDGYDSRVWTVLINRRAAGIRASGLGRAVFFLAHTCLDSFESVICGWTVLWADREKTFQERVELLR